MTVKCIDKEFGITVGKEYKVISLETQGDFYRFINDFQEEKKYPSECFEIVKKQDDIKAKCIESEIADEPKFMNSPYFVMEFGN